MLYWSSQSVLIIFHSFISLITSRGHQCLHFLKALLMTSVESHNSKVWSRDSQQSLLLACCFFSYCSTHLQLWRWTSFQIPVHLHFCFGAVSALGPLSKILSSCLFSCSRFFRILVHFRYWPLLTYTVAQYFLLFCISHLFILPQIHFFWYKDF